MRARAPRIGLRPALIAAAAILLAVIPGIHAQSRPDEVRAPWVLVGLAGANAVELPLSRDHIVYHLSYDGLTGPNRGTECLSQVGHAAFMQ